MDPSKSNDFIKSAQNNFNSNKNIKNNYKKNNIIINIINNNKNNNDIKMMIQKSLQFITLTKVIFYWSFHNKKDIILMMSFLVARGGFEPSTPRV